MMRAVSDAGTLIHLSWIQQVDLLERIFEEVFVPPAVRDEVLPVIGPSARPLGLVKHLPLRVLT